MCVRQVFWIGPFKMLKTTTHVNNKVYLVVNQKSLSKQQRKNNQVKSQKRGAGGISTRNKEKELQNYILFLRKK